MKLSDLVSQLQKLAPHVEPTYLKRQVRYWTAVGLVGEEEEIQDRPRRHRNYDKRHLYRAALLVEIANYGIPQRLMQPIVEQLVQKAFEYRNKYNVDPFDDAYQGTAVALIFYFFHSQDGKLQAVLEMGRPETELTMPFPSSWITINLKLVLARVN